MCIRDRSRSFANIPPSYIKGGEEIDMSILEVTHQLYHQVEELVLRLALLYQRCVDLLEVAPSGIACGWELIVKEAVPLV